MPSEAAGLLAQQQCDYEEMLALGRAQTDDLVREDLAAVDRAFVRIHQLMTRTRLREPELAALDRGRPEVVAGLQGLERVLLELQDLRQRNQELAVRLRDRTAAELRRLGQGRSHYPAAPPPPVSPRLFDQTR
jgi:hypothetical protein